MVDKKNKYSYKYWVIEVVKGINDINGKLDKDEVVKKLLRTPSKYNSYKVYVIEERRYLEKYTIDPLWWNLFLWDEGVWIKQS